MLNKCIGNYSETTVSCCVFAGLLQYIISKATNADHLAWTESKDPASFEESCLH